MSETQKIQSVIKNEMSFWQIVFYISWSVLAIWLILKVIGVIQTPVWLEYGVPVASVLIGVFAIYTKIIESITGISIELSTLNFRVGSLENKIVHVEKDIELIKRKI